MRSQPDSTRLESDLRRVLARPPVPDGLGARVMSEIRREGLRGATAPRRGRSLPWRTPRARWALAGCAFAASALLSVAIPMWRENRGAERIAMEGHERQLAEVLWLAGSKWNEASRAAFPPLSEDGE